VVNAASYIGGAVSPGELVTLFGIGIGPATAAGATHGPGHGQAGDHHRRRAGVVQWHTGSMIYASSTQVSAVVPYEMALISNPSVWIAYAGQISNAYPLTVAAAAPGVFAQNASGSGTGHPEPGQQSEWAEPSRGQGQHRTDVHDGRRPDHPAGDHGKITGVTLPPPQVTPAPVQPILVSTGGQASTRTPEKRREW